ncbi:membrane-bound alkaline phosphatase-like [Choristoneura fumiferana]|uniref:membrane-bound alkaline phosphatase-like n=1 Tax=Choristoneura fumiferana TaxID=7141 RepID=UPI003D15C9B2
MFCLLLLLSAPLVWGHHARSPKSAVPPIALETDPQYWYDEAFEGINRIEEEVQYDEVARNIVMFLGDGLSLPTLAAARALAGQRRGAPGEETRMGFEEWPVTGLAKTYCLNAQVADSACTATAYLCGAKNNDYTIGVSGRVLPGDCKAAAEPANQLDSLLAWAIEDGRSAGIVTTTRVTHASPAGAYAHTSHRYYESDQDVREMGADLETCPDIAYQLIHSYPGNQFKVILGGGRREFRPNTTIDEEGAAGRRGDGRDLVQEWEGRLEGQDHSYVWNRTALLEATENPPEYLLGLFESGHMQYQAEAGPEEPTLEEMTTAAIKVLSSNPRGFVLFVEGGRIDHAHHDNLALLALDETVALAAAAAAAERLLQADSLLLLTADHSHVFAYNGYSPRGNDILGTAQTYEALDKLPYMTLSYTNGPGARAHIDGVRPDVTKDSDFGSLHWMSPADVPIEWETHGGEDVAVFARGPQQKLFTGLYEQSAIPHRAAYAACVGPAAEKRAACKAYRNRSSQTRLRDTLMVAPVLMAMYRYT